MRDTRFFPTHQRTVMRRGIAGHCVGNGVGSRVGDHKGRLPTAAEVAVEPMHCKTMVEGYGPGRAGQGFGILEENLCQLRLRNSPGPYSANLLEHEADKRKFHHAPCRILL